jgi:hypothetical protein
MSAQLFKPQHLKKMIRLAREQKVNFAFTNESAPRLVLDDGFTGKELLVKLKKETGDKRGCGGRAWIEGGVFHLQPDKPLPGLKTAFIEMAKESELKVKKCKVLGPDGRELARGQDGSSFAEAAQDLLEDDDAVEAARRMYAGSDESAYAGLQRDLDAARRVDAGQAPAGTTAPEPGTTARQGKGKAPTGPTGTWDPRQVDGFGPSLYEQARPWEIENPNVDIEIDPATGRDKTGLGGGGGRKMKFSLPFKTKGKYVRIDGMDITFEGTINAGDAKAVGVQGLRLGESKDGKSKGGAGFKISAKNWEEKFGNSISVKLKTQIETGILGEKDKFELAEIFEVKAGPVLGEIKLVAVSYDGSEWSGPALKPSLGLAGSWELELDGIPVVCTGKATIGITVKVEWMDIILEIGKRKGAEWALKQLATRAAAGQATTAVAAGATETVATGFAAITAAEAVVVSGAMIGIAATIFALYKSAEEIQGIKEAAKMAKELSDSFQRGYLAGYGLKVSSGGTLFDKGRAISREKFKIHLERAKERFKQQTGQSMTEEEAKEVAKQMVEAVRKNETAFRAQVHGMFDGFIRAAAVRAWKEKFKDEPYVEKDEKYLRTMVNLKDTGELPSEPDWQYDPGQGR